MEIEKKQRMVRIFIRAYLILQLLLLAALIGFTCNAQNADDILGKAAIAYDKSNGIEAAFTTHTRSEQQNVPESFSGVINMKGEKFMLKTPDMRIWFDGKTQWAYMERNDEVNVTTPSGEELQMTNPVLLLGSYKKGFTPLYKGESTAANGKSAYDIELTPRKKGDIQRVSLQIEKNTYLPVGISVDSKNGVTMTIRISKLRTEVNQPDSYFVFKDADFPDAEVIDLR
ncbi:LolA family protein [Parabacteroides chinchillae]